MAKNRLVPTNALTGTGAINGIGHYYGGANSSGGALLHGANWDSALLAGVLAVSLSDGPSGTAANVGFRCVFRPSIL